MRKYAQRVVDLRDILVNEIKEWFVNNPEVLQIEFKRMFTVQVDVASNSGDYDWGIEMVVINFLANDGVVIDNEGNDISLTELSCSELAFILDEIEENKYIITNK